MVVEGRKVEDWRDFRFVQTKRGGRIETSGGITVALIDERFTGTVEDMLSAAQDVLDAPEDFDYAG